MSTTPPPDLAVAYLRVSTAGQAADGTSLESQEATTRARVHLLMPHSVGGVTIRTTLSGIAIAAEVVGG